MAGDWIKVEMATATKPEVMRIARILGMDRYAVFGRLVHFWSWADQNSVDGIVDGATTTDIDALVDAPGFAAALARVCWLQADDDAERLTLHNFDRHNGKTAKNRALKTERQKRYRSKSVDAPPSTIPSLEKRREESKEDIYSKPDAKHFNRFWDSYPRQKGKKPAFVSWKRQGLDGIADQIISHVEKRISIDRQWLDGYIPHGSTFVSQRGWDDEYDTAPTKCRGLVV